MRARLSFTDTVAAVERLVKLWPQATTKLIEDKANGTAVLDSLRKKVAGLLPVNPTESKYARASAIGPFVAAGNVWLPERDVALFDVDAFIEECAAFPNGAAHDDQVDATSQALSHVYLRMGQGAAFLEAWKAKIAKQTPVAGCGCSTPRYRDDICLSCGEPRVTSVE